MSSDKVDALNMSDLGAALTSETIHNALKETPYANFMRNLPPIILKRVEVLRQIQSEHDELKAKFLEERRALEDKYEKLYEPLHAKRYDIVNGVVEVDGVSNEPADQEADKLAEVKGVPNFWLTAMKTNEVLIDSIDEQDEDALKYLKDIKWSRIDVPTKVDRKKGEATEGFKLEFFFNPNPYFKNSVLTKTYFMVDEDGPILEKAIGTEIEWFPGKCLTEKLLKKKPMKGSKNAKPITKVETVYSFFNFFSPPEVPEDPEEIEEEEAEELQSRMELDYDIGLAIRKQIIPHAVSWFTGEADPFDDEEEEDGSDDEEDDDSSDDEEDDDVSDDEEDDDGDYDKEEEDEGDDDEEDEDDDITYSKNKGTAKAQAGVAQQEAGKPPECKQQ